MGVAELGSGLCLGFEMRMVEVVLMGLLKPKEKHSRFLMGREMLKERRLLRRKG